MPTPPTKKYLNGLIDACDQLRDSGDSSVAAGSLETPRSYPARAHRSAPSPDLSAAILRRDHFSCRYCGTKVVPLAVLKAAALTWPKELPYDASLRPDVTHPVFMASAATFDLVAPIALHADEQEGRSDDEAARYVTACWGCSAQKGDLTLKRLGWEVRKPKDTGWDGLVGRYEDLLAHRADKAMSAGERTFHVRWLRAFGLDPEALKRWDREVAAAA